MTTQSRTGECPECGALLHLNDPMIREIVTCEDCGSTLEVAAIEPLVLEIAELEGEDWGE